MPIVAMTGKLRHEIETDLGIPLGVGIGSAYAFWYFYYVPSVRRKHEFYLKLEKKNPEDGQLDSPVYEKRNSFD